MVEYIVVAIAAMLAGVGTGLVGLSAATAMVPLLVVLCPTFAGEHGAYMAIAIALASDILGSAVTTVVYAKNKKIDLRHGWIMLVCIVGMCTIGSIIAFFTHQQVLGGFSLFLCVAIGIRFLVKPDSKKEDGLSDKHKLTAKEIAVSLFFGLTIGFGTGFFGSGGGMMMLIVFTAFLGYDRRTAVGTSTFIMTFTALIASVSHMIMEPALVLEEWRFLILSIVVATVASLVSAQFANKVNTKTVGIITGALLFVLGLVLIVLNYRDYLPMEYIKDFLCEFAAWVGVIALAAVVLMIVWFTSKVPDFIFRKLLHMIAVFSILPLVLLTDIWWESVLCTAVFLGVIYLVLHCLEHFSFYDRLFVQKRKHEIIRSFLGLYSMMAIFLTVCWGLLGRPFLAVAAIMAWGPGDAMAAIIGITRGKRKLTGRHIEGTKSVEGTVTMGITSFLCVLCVLLGTSAAAWYIVLPLAIVVAIVSAFVELYTKGGWDTVTVPVCALAVLMLLLLVS